MKTRLVRPVLLLTSVAVSALLFWWLQPDPPAAHSRIATTPAPVATAPTLAINDAEDLAALLKNLADGVRTAETLSALQASLQRLLERPGALPNEGILTFKTPQAYLDFLARAGQSGLTVVGKIDGLQTARVRYNSLDALASDLLSNSTDYTDVGANYVVQAPTVPTTQQRDAIQQAAVNNNLLSTLGVTSKNNAWGQGVTIAVLDSGVAPDATLAGRLNTFDLGLGTAPATGDGHGTAVASLVAGAATDAPGVAPSANILSIRVTGDNGLSDLFTLSQGIMTAVDSGAQIVNISLGAYSNASTLTNAIDYATSKGVVLVASAGNDQAAQLVWPAADPRVVSVGSVDALGQQDTFSNSGPQLKLTAPGYDVQTAWLDGQRVNFTGTSASAPVVAGALAALISENPGMTGTQALAVLQQYSSDGGVAGADPAYGSGTVNLGWAMDRNNAARVDTAVSSHYYDATTGTMNFVVQNRSGQAMSGMTLSVQASGSPTDAVPLPSLDAGATYTVPVPVNQSQLTTDGLITYRTVLTNAPGVVDQVPGNNRAASTLTAPPAPAPAP